MNNSTMFEALSKVESSLTLCKCTARLLDLLPLEENPYADEIIAISNAIEMQLERTHDALERAYKEGKSEKGVERL